MSQGVVEAEKGLFKRRLIRGGCTHRRFEKAQYAEVGNGQSWSGGNETNNVCHSS